MSAVLVLVGFTFVFELGRYIGWGDLEADEAWFVETWAELVRAVERVRDEWPGCDDLVWMDREVQAFALALGSHEGMPMAEIIGTAIECVAPAALDREQDLVPVAALGFHAWESA